ncbi:PREDICTED: uncharacterized protein LOC109588787 [Amphimedon queenslandica]|uniref:ZSWIM3 N-terminal domain-containing protein n=1 Tax=Amphimedon queenslandica TaxID=400682 RepID=A0AAN0JU93_AMPQE|nr:PREDICTED: uncharacterized protein LOC109588787 [Amphimedon queenslandica]|eukprot:XP_019860459.1 PREDICTED: uncharacterized protein LOC109588787 [Amphimedon queenslandica]
MITWCLNHARLHTCLIMAAVFSKSVSSAEHSEAKARPQVPSFVLGERFESYDELEAKLKQYEKATYTQWWKRDCRTVDAAKRRVNRQLSDKIRYYEVVFKCINGGRKFKSKGEGIRSTMTFRQNCPAELSLRMEMDWL